jgi:hypothetical protein
VTVIHVLAMYLIRFTHSIIFPHAPPPLSWNNSLFYFYAHIHSISTLCILHCLYLPSLLSLTPTPKHDLFYFTFLTLIFKYIYIYIYIHIFIVQGGFAVVFHNTILYFSQINLFYYLPFLYGLVILLYNTFQCILLCHILFSSFTSQ